ncbi:MAG: LPXTG cell wall anchor domain-containing protein [Tyzzerella sp.]|nr:LPXTG cell wall anchor domain-containing protein [Tyzzerella sp.]
MKKLKNLKGKILSFTLALAMIVSVFAGGNMLEVEAETDTVTYAPYYDAEQKKVCDAPSIGTRISPTDIFSAGSLNDDERFEWKVYFTEDSVRDGSENPGLYYVIYADQTSEASGLGTWDEKNDWIVTNVYFEENVVGDFNKRLVVEGYSVEAPTIISPTISFDWNGLSAFTIGESVPNVEDVLVSVTGESIKDTFMLGLQIKATQEHVKAGYITDSMYSNAKGGWISAEDYSSDYKISETDVYGYAFELQTEDIQDTYRVLALVDNADIKNNINVIADGVVVDMAYAYSCYYLCDFAMVYLNLGTGADIEEAINPSTQEPVTPPADDDKDPVTPGTGSGETVFTDETADAILDANEILVNCTSQKVWESTEEDPYALPARIVKTEDGTESYELVSWYDAETYIRIDYVYTFVDDTELTWLKDFKDSAHPDSMYDVTYPIVLQDAAGNIYVQITSHGMPEGSWNETIGVVPKDIYDGYMEYVIGKLREEASNTENDYKGQLSNESDVKTKVELTKEEKAAIADGEELEIVLVFNDAGTKADNEEKKAIEKELGANKLGTFLDIDLIKKIASTEVEVSETTGLISITFEMPEALKNTDKNVVRTYKIMRYHDGKVDILDANYDEKTGFLTFETDKFSTYAVVYSDAKANTTTNTATTVPQTGDTSNTVLYVAMLCLAMCAVTVVLRKQRLQK